MSRVGYCVTVYLLLLAHAPAVYCLDLPQQELGGPHSNPERNFGGLPNIHEFNEFEHGEGFQHPERFQQPQGFENRERFNKPDFEIQQGLENPERLHNFEQQHNEQINQPQFETLDFQQGQNEQDILHRIEFNELDKSKNIHNYQLEHGEKGLLPGLEPGIQRFERFEHKEKGLLQPNELNGSKKSQGGNFEIGQQQGGLLQDIQSEGRQQFKINNFGNRGNKEFLQKNPIIAFNNAQGLPDLEIIEQQNPSLEKLKVNRLKQTQNLNIQQGHESQGVLHGNELGIFKNAQKQKKIQQGNILEGIGFNGERRVRDIELQKEKKEQQLLSQNFNGPLNRQVFTQPIQTNQHNIQEINRFTQPPGQTFPYNRPTFPHHFYFNENRPDKATVQRMIEEAHILAQNLRKIQQNLKNPFQLPTAPVPGSPLKLAHPNIRPNNAESFSVNVQPVSQSNGQSVVKLNQINSKSFKAELENADKILLDDLARRGYRINEVTHKLEKIPGAAQVNPLPLIQTAPISQPEVLRAISSAESALEKTVSQVSASAQATANADSSSQFSLPPAIPTILNTADLSSTLDRSGQVSINVGVPSIEQVPGQVLSQSMSSSSQSPSIAVSVPISSSSSLGSQSEQGTINGISSIDNQSNPLEISVDRSTSPFIVDLPGPALSGFTSNIAASPSSSVSISTINTIGSSVAAPNVVDLPGQVLISSTSPSTDSSVSVNTSSSSAEGQSGPVAVSIDSNPPPDLPGQEKIGTTSSSIKSPISVSTTTSSMGGQSEQVILDGITTTLSSKDDQSGTVPIILGSNTSPSVGDLPGQVMIDTTLSSAGSPISVNAVSTSTSFSGGQPGLAAINGITTTSSNEDQPGAVPITLQSNISHNPGDFPGQVIINTISSSADSPITVSDGQLGSVTINGVTTTTSSKDHSGAVSVTVGNNSATSIGDLPGHIGIDTVSSSVSSPESVSVINTSSASTSGQSVTVDGITTDLSPTGSVSFTTSPIVEDFPRKVVVISTSPSTEGSVSINAVSSSSSSTGAQPSQVEINGGTITTSSKEERSGPVTVTEGSGGSPGQLTIESTSSSTGSPVSVSSVRTSSSVAGKKRKLPLRRRLKLSSTTSPTEILSGSLVENTGKITISRVNTTSTSTPDSETVTITTVNNGKTVIDGQHAEITSTSSHPLPGFETEFDSHDIVTTISNSSFSTSDERDKLSESEDSLQNQLLINKRHIPKHIFKRLDPGAHNKQRISQLITAPKNSDKLFQLILKFNSTLDKYMNLYGNETPGINTKHKLLMELPWDKENLGPAAFIDKYLKEEWHSNITNEIEESGKIRDSRYRKPNSRSNHPKKKGFIIDGTELIPLEKTTILPGSSVDNRFDWTGTEHANSCHGDCNAEPACGYTCGRTCVDYKKPSRFCNRHEECNVGACQCKPGFVLDLNTNRCVRPEQCSQCGVNEYLDECPDLCIPEDCPSRGPQSDCSTNDDCPKPVCRCIMNYRRNKNDVCVPIQQCPKLKCNGPNEVYTPCARDDLDENCASGLPQCFTSKIQNQSPVICIPRCTCAPGHLRNGDNECVPVDQCSSTSYREQEIEDETTEEEVIEI